MKLSIFLIFAVLAISTTVEGKSLEQHNDKRFLGWVNDNIIKPIVKPINDVIVKPVIDNVIKPINDNVIKPVIDASIDHVIKPVADIIIPIVSKYFISN